MDRVSQSKEMYFSTVSLGLDSGGFVPVRLPSAVRAELESVLESASAGCGPQHGRNSTIFVTRGRRFFLRGSELSLFYAKAFTALVEER
jgi:hypothetical protein